MASFGQQREIDSLKTALNRSKGDTGRVVILYNLAAKFIRISPDSTFNYLNKTVDAYNKVLSASEKNSQYNSNQKEQIRSTINRIKARSALTRGAAFVIIANLPEGLKYSLEAVKLFSSLSANTDNLSGLASALKNTGIIFFKLEDHDKALEYYGKAQDVAKKIGDKKMIANISDNIQSVYLSIADNEPDRKKAEKLYRTALANYLETEKIYTELNDPILIGMTNGSIGFVYIALKDYAHALPYLQKSAQIHEEMGDNISLAYDRSQLAVVQTALKNYSSAENYLNLALASSEEDGSIEAIMDLELIYYLLDSSRGHFQDAIEHYKNYISASDSINNVDNAKKQTRLEMQFNFDRKEADAKAEQEKKDLRQRNIRYSISIGLIGALFFLGVVYRQRNKIKKEKQRSEELLLNILPEEVADELKTKGEVEAKLMDEVTVLFTDFKGFTQLSEKLSPKELVAEIDLCFRAFDHIMHKHGVEKIKTIGDAYMAAGGLPIPNKTHAVDVVNAALDIQQFMQQHKEEREAQGKLFFEIRIGIHTGPVVAGIVGVKKFAYDIWGDTVNTASRMESSGEAGKINISETTHALIKDQFSCTHRGKISAKGKGEIDMYFVVS